MRTNSDLGLLVSNLPGRIWFNTLLDNTTDLLYYYVREAERWKALCRCRRCSVTYPARRYYQIVAAGHPVAGLEQT